MENGFDNNLIIIKTIEIIGIIGIIENIYILKQLKSSKRLNQADADLSNYHTVRD